MTNEEIKNAVNKVFEKVTDTESLKQLAVINNMLDQKQAEDDSFLKQHVELANEYKKAVVSGSFKPTGSNDETGNVVERPKTFEECMNEFLKENKTK